MNQGAQQTKRCGFGQAGPLHHASERQLLTNMLKGAQHLTGTEHSLRFIAVGSRACTLGTVSPLGLTSYWCIHLSYPRNAAAPHGRGTIPRSGISLDASRRNAKAPKDRIRQKYAHYVSGCGLLQLLVYIKMQIRNYMLTFFFLLSTIDQDLAPCTWKSDQLRRPAKLIGFPTTHGRPGKVGDRRRTAQTGCGQRHMGHETDA